MELDAETPKPPAPPIPPPPPPDPPTPSAVQAGAQISYAAAPAGPTGGGPNGIMPPGAPAFYQDPYSSFSQYGATQQYADPQVRIDNTSWELFSCIPCKFSMRVSSLLLFYWLCCDHVLNVCMLYLYSSTRMVAHSCSCVALVCIVNPAGTRACVSCKLAEAGRPGHASYDTYSLQQ